MTEFSISTENLGRIFKLDRAARQDAGKELIALKDINLNVKTGELFGLLGPNGAGKTTTIRILCTLLLPTHGRALICGHDVVKDIKQVRPIINMVSGGETCGYGILSAKENLRLFTELYGIPWRIAKPRVERMLHEIGLDKFKNVRTHKLSTGMRQRVNFARGFTTDPKVLFLDEPTVGLDVPSARHIRGFLKEWLAENPERTILLTTHYMAEADELCDRIAVVNEGSIVACDKPSELKKMVKKETILDITINGIEPPPAEWKDIRGVSEMTINAEADKQVTQIHALLADPEAGGELIRSVTANGRRLVGMETQQPTLEDVFLKLTGRSLVAEEVSENGEAAV